jgi:hypothetical protein
MTKEEKKGFVYLWYDRKHKRFYLGCHVGKEDDGYICSSKWMRDAYRYRKHDFKRRILKRDIPRSELLAEEHKWLDQIKDDELGKKYYNLSKRHFGHWANNERVSLTVKQKLSIAAKNQERVAGHKHSEESKQKMRKPKSEEAKRNMSLAKKGKPSPMKGTTDRFTPEAKEKISNHFRGKSQPDWLIEKRAKSNTGKKRSAETKKLIAEKIKENWKLRKLKEERKCILWIGA